MLGLFSDQAGQELAEKEAEWQKERDALYAEIGRLTTQMTWLEKNLVHCSSRTERRELIDWENRELPVKTQAQLLSLNRSGLYYQPLPPSPEEVAFKHRIDAIYTEHPYYGYRKIAAQLHRDGYGINQKTVAQYLSFFILGVIAFRRNWFQTIPNSMGRTGFVVALVATVVLFPLAVLSSRAGAVFVGQGSWQSAVYAFWDSTFSVGMCLGLLTLFRHFFNRQNRFGRFLSQQAYTVYIIHIPIIVELSLALRGIHPESLLKFALVALIGVPLCSTLAFLVRKIPFASRIL